MTEWEHDLCGSSRPVLIPLHLYLVIAIMHGANGLHFESDMAPEKPANG